MSSLGVSRSGRDDADLRLNAALSGLLVSDEHSPITCAVAALNSLDAGSDYIFSLLKWHAVMPACCRVFSQK